MTTTQQATAQAAEAIDMTAIEAELRPKSTEELRFIFHECHHGAAKFIARGAACVKLLQERGDSMTGIPMVGTYRRIAAGQILPDLVWKFIESPNRQIVERLPLPDQRRIAADPMVVVVEAKPQGGFDKRKVDLTTAPRDVANLVAGPDGIRNVEEQMAYLGAQKARPAPPKVSAEDEPAEEPLTHEIRIRLTASELEALKIRAALAHATEREIARRFLIQSGALKRPKT